MLPQHLLQVFHHLTRPVARQMHETLHLHMHSFTSHGSYLPWLSLFKSVCSGSERNQTEQSRRCQDNSSTDLCHWNTDTGGLPDGADVAVCVHNDCDFTACSSLLLEGRVNDDGLTSLHDNTALSCLLREDTEQCPLCWLCTTVPCQIKALLFDMDAYTTLTGLACRNSHQRSSIDIQGLCAAHEGWRSILWRYTISRGPGCHPKERKGGGERKLMKDQGQGLSHS